MERQREEGWGRSSSRPFLWRGLLAVLGCFPGDLLHSQDPPPRALGFSQLTSESWESPNLSGSKDLPRGMVSADTQEQVTKVLSLLDS